MPEMNLEVAITAKDSDVINAEVAVWNIVLGCPHFAEDK